MVINSTYSVKRTKLFIIKNLLTSLKAAIAAPNDRLIGIHQHLDADLAHAYGKLAAPTAVRLKGCAACGIILRLSPRYALPGDQCDRIRSLRLSVACGKAQSMPMGWRNDHSGKQGSLEHFRNCGKPKERAHVAFPQEKASFRGSQKVYVYSENAPNIQVVLFIDTPRRSTNLGCVAAC